MSRTDNVTRVVARYGAPLLLGLVIAALTVAAPTIVRWPLLWRSAERAMDGERGTAEILGYVSRVDHDGMVWVARNILDFGARAVKIGPHTIIRVGDKEGGIGDIWLGAPIAVLYEVASDELTAKWIGVYESQSALRAARAAKIPEVRAEPPVSALPTPVLDRPAPPVASLTSPPRADAPPAPPVASTRSDENVRRSRSPARTRDERRPSAPVATSPAPTAPIPSPPPAATRSSAAAQGAQGARAEDPGAVIDWLLKKNGPP